MKFDDRDFQDEIRAHLEMATADRVVTCLIVAAPEPASLKEFGNVTLTTEAARRVWTPWWAEALSDACQRRSLRDPARSPRSAVCVDGRRGC
jgi:hypothetical protein